jgi:hypothetical protein
MPERYGNWKSVYYRFARLRRDGTIDRMRQRLQLKLDKDGRIDWDLWCIDGTNVRASRSAAGAGESKTPWKNRRTTHWAAAEAGGEASSTWLLTAAADLAQPENARCAGVLMLKARDRFIQGQNLCGICFRREIDDVQRQFPSAAAPGVVLLWLGRVRSESAAWAQRQRGKSARGWPNSIPHYPPDDDKLHGQARRLQRVARLFRTHAMLRQLPQLIVDQRQQFGCHMPISLFHCSEKSGCVRHRGVIVTIRCALSFATD